eukprot:TRINITY_DN17762_c0_g1_i1.p1 TRINITY_DN17762_c0_g1~~TRINITY_DN17762_c0_g1_i1.p1  ORF type:complete len:124 (-),score=24.53 TRINITY_DN17762_c0_g1_i1:126-497(-)
MKINVLPLTPLVLLIAFGSAFAQDNSPVPVVITGLQILPQASQPSPVQIKRKQTFAFDNKTSLNLDGAGYALSLFVFGQIIILAMAFASGLGSQSRSFGNVKMEGLKQVLEDAEKILKWLEGY